MAWLYLSGHTTAFWWLLPVLLYPLFLPTPAWPAFVRFILTQGGWWRGGALMYVEDSFKGRNVNGPVMLCIHPHGASFVGLTDHDVCAKQSRWNCHNRQADPLFCSLLGE